MNLQTATATDAANAYTLPTDVSTLIGVGMASRTGFPVPVLVNLPALGHHIHSVIKWSSIKNMIGIYARWIVASMASVVIWILSVFNKIGNTVSKDISAKAIVPKASVTSVVFVTKPFPAGVFVTFNNFSPKSFFNRDRGRARIMLRHSKIIPQPTRVSGLVIGDIA